MTKNTITKREALAQIKAIVSDYADLVAYCDNEIALLDRKSAKSAEKNAEKSAAYADMRTAIKGVLANTEGMTATDIAKAIDTTCQKATYAMRDCVKDGTITVATVKGKSIYKLA